ncbi:hypothetical protein OS493_036420 [Desmophyllum pertusum]|uniref:GH3 auxin-responsive promoter n=1 Tax=Desmophyllum pertusum TaxID=174260 RepID=A0A9X0CN13_9CNID|nr:hypothetical protein OS493_036420 [Desmophyllum pertusum]
MFTNLAQTMYRGFLILEENWERLVKDIEEGRIGPDIELDAETRSELNSYLKPDKKRAQELKEEFQTGFAGIAPRIWPNLNIILCVTTGPEELYAKKLREKYIGHVPMYSAIYSTAFFEFLPIDECRKEQPKTRLPEDLELDSLYELVVTTRGGLYRYRMGDVVKVVRYHNKCPVFEFQYRSGRLLTGHVTEKMMYNALMTSLQCFDGKVQLEEYTCAESVLFDALPETGTEEPKGTFHVVFVELNGVLEEDEKRLLQGKLDEALRNLNIIYDERRVLGVDLSTRLYRVKQGTFDKLREYLMSVNPMTSPIQFKTPRVITSKEAGKLLLGNLHL